MLDRVHYPKAATAVLFCICLLGSATVRGQTVDGPRPARPTSTDTVIPSFDAEFRDAIEKRVAAHRGTVGLALVDLDREQTLSIRGDERFPSASVVKVALMVEVFARVAEGGLALSDPLTLLASDRTVGSGILQFLAVPKEITVWDATFLMIMLSDNTATNLLLEKIRPLAVNERMKALGLENTIIFGHIGANAEESFAPDSIRRYGFGTTTPMEMAALFTRLHRGELVSAQASQQMVRILDQQLYRHGIPRYLPEDVAVMHKTGAMDHVRNDCGIVRKPDRPFVVCVFTRDNADTRFSLDNEADDLIADLARIAWDRLGATPD